MVLAYILLIFSPLADTLEIQDQVSEQAKAYVYQLKEGNNSELNIWAINQLAMLDCKALKTIQHEISLKLPEYSEFYKNILCDEENTSSLDLFAQQFWSDQQSELYNRITEGKTILTKEILPLDKFPLIHLKLLMSTNYDEYYNSEYLNEALDSWTDHVENHKHPENLEYSITISNIIWAAFRLKKFQIIQKYHQVFLDSKLLPVSLHKLRILNAIDYVFYTLGHYDKSLDIQRNYSIPLAQYTENKKEVNEILLRQGVYLYSLGKYEESKNVYENLYEKSGEGNFYIFTNLGINYYKLGYSNRYISLQLRALEHDVQNYENLLTVYRNLFLYYTNVKDVNSALRYIDKAKELAIANADTTELALIDFYLGSFYWSTYKDHKKALHHMDLAEKALPPEKNYRQYIDLQIEKSLILTKTNSLEAAESTLGQAIELALSKSDTPSYLDALINLTAIKLKQQDLAAAKKNLDEIKLYSLDDLDFPTLTKYYTVRAEYLDASGSKRTAIAELTPVLEQVIDRAKNNTDSQEGYWSVEDEYLDAFSILVKLLIETNEQSDALKLLDQLKTINDASLYNNPLVKASKLSEEELAEEKRLNQRLQNLRKQYLNANQEKRFSIKAEISRTSAAREQILAGVNLAKDKPMPPVWSIQRSIKPDELLLHFTEIGTQLYVTYLTTNDTQIRIYDFDVNIQEQFNNTADGLASGRTNLNQLHKLYQFLELDKIPSHIKQLSVVPDNHLYRIPLEVLPTHKPDTRVSFGGTHYLLEDYQFRYFTSLKEFDSNRRAFTAETERDFSGFAISDFKDFKNIDLPSLPYATIETREINTSLTSFNDKEVYTGNDATKDVFKKQVGTSRLVHVATHSEVSEQDPLFSTIYLKNSNVDDTLESDQALYAYELFDTPLNSEFIMLNSCSSGSGNFIQGSGVMGITRALRYAGAKSLALNLWSVNDKVASEFAADFYHYLNEGETKSSALRKAKLNQLQQSNANPHFWGAYLMIGNPSPVTSKPSNPLLLYSLLAATMLLTGYITFRKEIA